MQATLPSACNCASDIAVCKKCSMHKNLLSDCAVSFKVVQHMQNAFKSPRTATCIGGSTCLTTGQKKRKINAARICLAAAAQQSSMPAAVPTLASYHRVLPILALWVAVIQSLPLAFELTVTNSRLCIYLEAHLHTVTAAASRRMCACRYAP